MGAAVLMLLAALYAFDGRQNSDAAITLILSMLFLTFPGGRVYAASFSMVAMALEEYFLIAVATRYFTIMPGWAALFALGYFQ